MPIDRERSGHILDQSVFIPKEVTREAALVLAGIAISKGAKSVTHDGELAPCGLDVVLDALFEKETED